MRSQVELIRDVAIGLVLVLVLVAAAFGVRSCGETRALRGALRAAERVQVLEDKTVTKAAQEDRKAAKKAVARRASLEKSLEASPEWGAQPIPDDVLEVLNHE